MKRLILLILLTFSFAALSSSLEEEVGLIHDKVDLKLRLMNTIIQTNQRLELVLGSLEREGASHEEFERKWALEFEAIAKNYIEEQMRLGAVTTADKRVLRKFFEQLKWDELSQLHLKTWRKLRPIARAKGVTLMAALVVVNILNYVVPYTLTLLGQPYLGAVIFAAPVNPPTVFVYQSIARIKTEIEMRKILGGAKGVRAFRELDRKVLAELSLVRATDYFTALPASEDMAIRVREGGLFDTVIRLFGLRSEDLSLNGLKRFLKDEKALSPIYEQILRDRDLSESVKTSLIIHNLSQEDGTLFSKFKIRFSKNIVKRPRIPLEMTSLEAWVARVLKSKSAEDIFFQLQNTPSKVHPFHLLTTWEQVILPELAHGEQLSYREMRSLTTRFNAFRLKKELFLEEMSVQSVRADMQRYFRGALRRGAKACFHTPGEVIGQLLKAH